MARKIDVREFDTGFMQFNITLDYDPFFIVALKKIEAGDDFKIAGLQSAGRYLPYVRKNIINNYMIATKPRAITGRNRLVNRTGNMASSLTIRKNIPKKKDIISENTGTDKSIDDGYVALFINNKALNKRSGVKYPIALETGWRGYTKRADKFFDTTRFIPPFFYAEESFLMDLDKFGKILLRSINSVVQEIGQKYMKENLKVFYRRLE